MECIDKDVILEYLRDQKDVLLEKFGVTKIALFGSYARDEQHRDSDIDLLIETDRKDYKNRFFLKEYLEKEFNRKVDVNYFDSVRLFIRHHIEKDLIYA